MKYFFRPASDFPQFIRSVIVNGFLTPVSKNANTYSAVLHAAVFLFFLRIVPVSRKKHTGSRNEKRIEHVKLLYKKAQLMVKTVKDKDTAQTLH